MPQRRFHLSPDALRPPLFLLLAALAMPLCAQLRLLVIPAGETATTGARLSRDALPDTHVGHGSNDIDIAWLTQSTRRYPHGVLGDTIEAAALRVRLRNGTELSYTLPADSVFEDLIPRVHDLDLDGRDEVILVRSRQSSGASLMALGIREGKLVPLAETEPLGKGQWLNPVGMADVDGNGRMEFLVVLTPHADGTLIEYSFDGARFTPGHRVSGVSNHVAGSRDQGMSALMDANGDGIADVIVPSADRESLRVFAFDEGRPLEFARINLPGKAAGNFEVMQPHTLLVPLEDGRRLRIDWR